MSARLILSKREEMRAELDRLQGEGAALALLEALQKKNGGKLRFSEGHAALNGAIRKAKGLPPEDPEGRPAQLERPDSIEEKNLELLTDVQQIAYHRAWAAYYAQEIGKVLGTTPALEEPSGAGSKVRKWEGYAEHFGRESRRLAFEKEQAARADAPKDPPPAVIKNSRESINQNPSIASNEELAAIYAEYDRMKPGRAKSAFFRENEKTLLAHARRIQK